VTARASRPTLPAPPPLPPPPGFVARLCIGTGEPVVDVFKEVAGIYSVFVRTLYFSFRGRAERGAVLREMYEIGNRSLLFITVVMGFIGMIFVYQGGVQAQRIIPDLTMLGATYLEYLVRALASDIGAMMLATRVGAGIAAAIGSMVVTEQVDALRMCAAEPVDYLVVPRFKASLVMTVVLLIFGGVVACMTGYLTARYAFGQRWDQFFNLTLVRWSDVFIFVIKCVAYGAAIPVVSGYCGLTAYGGSEGVGSATTRAVVNSALAVIILNLVISAAGYIVFG
jgi:phospholipid/cholesterol/gamma-HCH transport system permease protein